MNTRISKMVLKIIIFSFCCCAFCSPEQQVWAASRSGNNLQTSPFLQGQVESTPIKDVNIALRGPDRNLYSWSSATGLIKMTDCSDVMRIDISPDGKIIAFFRELSPSQTFDLFLIGFDGSNPREIVNLVGYSPANMKWIPGTHRFTFTATDYTNSKSNYMIEVDADTGVWTTRHIWGKSGYASFSPDSQKVAVSSETNILVKDLLGYPIPGSGITFPEVSDTYFIPEPVWSQTGDRLAVFIPTQEPMENPRKPSSIWVLDVKTGEALTVGHVTPQFTGPVDISPDLTKIMYVKTAGEPGENKREIHSASLDGNNDRVMGVTEIPVTWNWSPNGAYYAYQSSKASPVTITDPDGNNVVLPGTEKAEVFMWIDSTRYLFTKVNDSKAELYLGDNGENKVIASLPASETYQIIIDFSMYSGLSDEDRSPNTRQIFSRRHS